MNKKFLCQVAVFLGLSFPVLGQTLSSSQQIKLAFLKQTDEVLQMLLNIPFEQRQYVFPALFENEDLPKKIRQHPEIAIWEGKVPTDIAPAMQGMAAEHLANLNPKLYLYLSPELFKENKIDLPAIDDTLDIPYKTSSVLKQQTGEPVAYQGIYSYFNGQSGNTKAMLSDDKITALGTGLIGFREFLKQKIDRNPKLSSVLSLPGLTDENYAEGRINPFQTMIGRIEQAGFASELQEELSRSGWSSPEEFALFVDTTLKAYRVNFLTLRMAFDVHRSRTKEIKNDTDKLLVMVSKMYEASPDDVRLVEKNQDSIRQMFIQNGYQNLLNAINIDELQK